MSFVQLTLSADIIALLSTRSFSSYCEVDLYSYADQTSLYTGFLCTNVPGTSTVLPFFTTDSSTVEFSFLPSEATVPSFVPLNPSQASTKSENTVALVSPTGSLTPTLPNPVVPATATSASSTPVHHAGLSGGAIAGIVVGALGAIVIIVGMLLFFLYFRRRDDKRQSMVSSQQPVNNQTGYAAPPMSQQPHQPSSNQLNPSSAPSYASPTSSTHPLAPQQPQSPSLQQQQYQSPMGVGVSNQDLGPGDSASQIGGPTNAYGQHQPPPAHEGSGNYFTSPSQSGAGGSPSGSPPQSGLGALPGQFQHQHSYGGGGQVPESTIGPGTAFQSIPPVRAPGVPGSPPGSPPPPASPLQQQQQHGGVSYMGGPQTQGSYIPGRGGTNEMQG